jgi:uncharacterized SAM-binding protein YcdF (DUF218 family)
MKQPKTYLLIAAALMGLAALLAIVPGFRFSILVCFAFAALCVLVYFLLKRPTPRTRRLLKIICIVLVVGAVAAGITGGFILGAAHPAQLPACRYVVVLGAGVNGTVPSLTLHERITAAYHYLSANPEAIAILSGGQGPGEDISEAACMYRELTELGISPHRLLQEDSSTSTIENLQFSLDVAEEETGYRPSSIGIVSSEYHIFRATRFAKGLGLDAVGIPAKTSWFPLRLNYYLREIVAIWKFLLLGP